MPPELRWMAGSLNQQRVRFCSLKESLTTNSLRLKEHALKMAQEAGRLHVYLGRKIPTERQDRETVSWSLSTNRTPRPPGTSRTVGLVGLIAWGLWPRGPQTEEDRIRLVIDQMATAVGDRQVGDVVDHFRESYRGELGDKRQLHGYLMAAFFRAQALVAVPSGVEVSVDGDRADVKLRLSLAQAPGNSGGDTLGSHRVEATFAREDGVWRVLTARRVR